ncbi:hypothetical protein Cgig2_006639 [Carnegiea gigantea]|uniref:Uncharacterized protein n=1 Tax=Carnegiea gigantea TaxID=171969 RepID=A0A9Q1GQA4_9CARY|nr:hypothetical protein Cgig2_006639 [Carnegiea gigantea]
MKVGYEPPEFFGFMFAAPGASKKKLPLLCDKDWLHLVSLWNYAKGEIPIYMLATTAPSRHRLIINELDGTEGTHSQTRPHTKNPEVVGPLENAPFISGSDEDEFDLLREDEYECMLSARQAKKWADSLICTPVQNYTCSSKQLVMLTQRMSKNRPWKPLRRNQKRLMSYYWMNHLNTRLEIFNGKTEKYRYKPIFSLLEAIRRKFMYTITNSLCKQFGYNKRSHRKNGVLQILKGKDKPSHKEKRGKRKVGTPSKEGPPAKKPKTAHQPSYSGAASEPFSSKKSARPSSSKKSGQPFSSSKSTIPSSFKKAPPAGCSMLTRQLRSLMQGSQLGISQTPAS